MSTERLWTAAELDAAEREVEVGPYSPEARAVAQAKRRADLLAAKETDARVRERIAVLQEQGREHVVIRSGYGLIVAVHEVPS